MDLSVISQDDAGTGIQRVVRAIATNIDERASVHFVYTYKRKHHLLEKGHAGFSKTTRRVEYRSGDVFFGLDFSLDAIWQMRREFARLRRSGVSFHYLVHDFLPLQKPDWFSAPTVLRFRNWLAIMAATADGFFCVSQVVARQLPCIIGEQFGARQPFSVNVIPMGADLAGSKPSLGLPPAFGELLKKMANAPTVLVVGTIEPRKGHADALRAFEHLWANGSPFQLLFVGGIGWKMDAFVEQLRVHPEMGKRLLWPGRLSDEALDLLYSACRGVLVPSHAEGFGLPLIEALGHGKPVLARNIEVFEPMTAHGVWFFAEDAEAHAIAKTIACWLQSAASFVAPPLAKWRDAAEFIMARLGSINVEQKQRSELESVGL
ncbi:glycosyltransferase involved in cell wall biosynthesis [Novosphingobium hassiacum]|uniref:Glycosyltransferase involved in cell wall biosynthesis n=1 Tax=Novosphingobium hassiacum TaxID=173676 RepID=A0A7W5ZSY3_9SPHN|nr:glycosyltransferase involved in cell wall biosynthesis [Novosphingobium hassiacum]